MHSTPHTIVHSHTQQSLSLLPPNGAPCKRIQIRLKSSRVSYRECCNRTLFTLTKLAQTFLCLAGKRKKNTFFPGSAASPLEKYIIAIFSITFVQSYLLRHITFRITHLAHWRRNMLICEYDDGTGNIIYILPIRSKTILVCSDSVREYD